MPWFDEHVRDEECRRRRHERCSPTPDAERLVREDFHGSLFWIVDVDVGRKKQY